MVIAKIIGILLIAAGALQLIDGGFTYTSDTHRAQLGRIAMHLKERETVYFPTIASVAVIAFGVLLVLGFNRN